MVSTIDEVLDLLTDSLGMGNRFRNMAGYKPLITAHGILAAITFLFVVPGAIFMARFYHRNPRLALRVHIWLQIMTLLLATALIVLGFQAVGLERSLTNPHHGIGVALYTLVVVQVLGGSIIHRLEKGKERFKVPLKLIVRFCKTSDQILSLTCTAAPMDWPRCSPSWCCANSSWSNPLWFTKGLIYLVCSLGFLASDCVLCAFLQKSARDGI